MISLSILDTIRMLTYVVYCAGNLVKNSPGSLERKEYVTKMPNEISIILISITVATGLKPD